MVQTAGSGPVMVTSHHMWVQIPSSFIKCAVKPPTSGGGYKKIL